MALGRRSNLTPGSIRRPGQGAIGVQISPVTEMAALGLLPAPLGRHPQHRRICPAGLAVAGDAVLGQLSPAEAQITGPVGIAQMVGGAVSATIDTGLWFPILRFRPS